MMPKSAMARSTRVAVEAQSCFVQRSSRPFGAAPQKHVLAVETRHCSTSASTTGPLLVAQSEKAKREVERPRRL